MDPLPDQTLPTASEQARRTNAADPAPPSLWEDDADADGALSPPHPGFVPVLRVRTALTAVPLTIGAIAIDGLVLRSQGLPWGWLGVAALFLAVIAIVTVPPRRFARMGHAMLADRLRVVDGYLFHVDTVVPFARVQHIDLTRGPVERMFGTATLVVHTAGTHNNIVVVPGLDPGEAEATRDAMRRHIHAGT